VVRIQLSPKPETWVRKEQAFYNETEDLNPKRENRDNTGTDWVRTKQTFYDTNY